MLTSILIFLNWSRLLMGASLVAQRLKRLPVTQETRVQSLGGKDPLEKGMATHSSTLAWRIPWREEPDGLQSTGSQRVGHDWATSLSTAHSHFDMRDVCEPELLAQTPGPLKPLTSLKNVGRICWGKHLGKFKIEINARWMHLNPWHSNPVGQERSSYFHGEVIFLLKSLWR